MSRFDLIVLYAAAVLFLVGAMLGLSHILGERHRARDTGRAYESGVVPTGSTRAHLWVPFYLLAILFVIFDLEVVFLFSWAVTFRDLGWSGFWGALVFIGVLAVALLYEWRQGTFDWGPRAPHLEPGPPPGMDVDARSDAERLRMAPADGGGVLGHVRGAVMEDT